MSVVSTPLMVKGAWRLVRFVAVLLTAFALSVNLLGAEAKVRASVSEVPESAVVSEVNVEGKFFNVVVD